MTPDTLRKALKDAKRAWTRTTTALAKLEDAVEAVLMALDATRTEKKEDGE